MKKIFILIVALALASQFGRFNLIENTGFCGDSESAKKSAPAKVYTSAETEKFRQLAKETLTALAASKKEEMVAKLTDLETAWDDQEKTLRPKNEETWTMLDKTLDKAISALRSSHTNLEKGRAALEDLLVKLEQATKP